MILHQFYFQANKTQEDSIVDCIFCKIASREIPSEIVYEDDDLLFFKDVNPQAPVHILGITKKHISSINDVEDGDAELIGKIFLKFRDIARQYPELEKGHRIIVNTGKESGQTVFHIHFHIIGGRHMGWPPG